MPIADIPPQTRRPALCLRIAQGSRSPSGQSQTQTLFNPSKSGQSRLAGSNDKALEQAKVQLINVAREAQREQTPLKVRALSLALGFLMDFQHNIASLTSQNPYITWSAEGEIVLEWRRGERQLIFYIDDQKICFLKAWGTDIYQQMEEGDVLSTQEINSLWQWLKN